ncbi:hypothetical protein GGS20DRAFT_531989 [Poronia punctata]|nr:hypothetical protein GGS20DRAFT_531989 [Poronia punctata]
MLALWSRAAQAQSTCRCRICLPSPNAIVRQSTAAATKRKVSAADLFTACYTTILGTAAIIDARSKEDRRRELDRELERARTSLRKLTSREPLRSLEDEDDSSISVLPNTLNSNEVSEHAVNPDTRSPPGVESRFPSRQLRSIHSSIVVHHRGTEAVKPLVEELRELCNMKYRPIAKPSFLQYQIAWAEIEAAIILEEHDPDIVLLEPRDQDHLTNTIRTVLHLIDSLIFRTVETQGTGMQDNNHNQPHTDFSVLMEQRHKFEYPFYDLPSNDPKSTSRARVSLNESIRRILNTNAPLIQTVSRICSNLLTVSVPPTIHTYNTLVAGFNRIGRPDLAEIVVQTYLNKTSFPATDQTIVCLLSHYRTPGGLQGMREAVQRMRGRLGGLHYAIVAEERPRVRDRYYTFKARRMNVTFDRLINGWLYHQEIGNAVMTFVACFRHGATIPVSTFQDLLRGCLLTVDFSSARKLAVGIAKHVQQFQQYLAWVIEDSTATIAREALQSLYQILNVSWMPFGEIFGRTWVNHKKAAIAMRELVSWIDLEMEAKQTARLPSQLFNALATDEPLYVRLDAAIAHLDAVESQRSTAVPYSKYSRLAMVVSIERRLVDLEERTNRLIAIFNNIFLFIQTGGYDMDKQRHLLSDGNGSIKWYNYRLALSRALCQMDMEKSYSTEDDIAFELVTQIPDRNMARQLMKNNNWQNMKMTSLVALFGDEHTPPRKQEKELGSPYTCRTKKQNAYINTINKPAKALTHQPALGASRKEPRESNHVRYTLQKPSLTSWNHPTSEGSISLSQ